MVGNKEDLIEDEEVDIDEVRGWAGSINAVFKKTSAKTAAGIQALFREIAGKLDSTLDVHKPKLGGLSLEREASKPHTEGCKC